jgi:fumarate reductase flavoprotein subunit
MFNDTPISRRAVLRGAFASAAAALTVGGVRLSYAADAYDVIVIGAGTVGIPLAIEAAARGAKVLIIEKSGQIGGTLYMSGGHMAAAGTRLQRRKGIVDSADIHYDDIMHLGHERSDPGIVRRYVDNAGPMADWLEDLGMVAKSTDPVKGEAHASFSVARYFQGPEFGRSILKVLRPPFDKAVAGGQVKVLTWTGAAELIATRDRGVVGVVAEDERGGRLDYHARSVVIASGGYCANRAKFKAVTGREIYGRMVYGYSQGHGLDLGVSAGGYVRGGELQVLGPRLLADRDYLSPVAAVVAAVDARSRQPWEIQVNKLGERYYAEDNADVNYAQLAFSRQPTARMWIVFDQEILDRATPPLIAGPRTQVQSLFDVHPMFFQADTLAELAAKAALPPTTLARTVEDYNNAVARKSDAAFGRKYLPLPITRAPFYAIETHGTAVVGFGGLAVDRDLRVLRANGSPVSNLYAAGEVIGLGATCGDTLVNGGAVTPALTFGRLLGKEILPIGSS